MKHVKLFESFLQGDSLEIFQGLADKLEQNMDKEKEYTIEDLNKELSKAGEAAMHSKDLKQIAGILSGKGFKINENESVGIEKGDEVIENPEYDGFGFEGEVGTVLKKDDSGDFISYLVKFGNEEQEYHDDEIIKAPANFPKK